MNQAKAEYGDRVAPEGVRLESLDLIRGVAVLGILAMNIVDFAMPGAAYFNPHAYGGAHGANYGVFLFNYLLVDGKLRGLFSVLFGASMLIVGEAAEAAGEDPATVHFRRMIWLLLFGLAHLWLLWDGDILSLYAPIGLFAFSFRGLPVRRLFVIAALLIAAQTVMVSGVAYDMHATEVAAAAPDASAATLKELAADNDTFGIPSRERIAEELRIGRAGYAVLTNDRFVQYPAGSIAAVLFVGLETLGFMLMGMALLRSGLLTGAWPRARYMRWLAIGFAVGLAADGAGAVYLAMAGPSPAAVALAEIALPTPFRPFMIIGWACLILLLGRPGGALTRRIAAAGRMAFTNYIATSLICSTLFYGYGLGWFGYLERAELYPIVLLVWIAILLWSKPWLAHFRYGPLEWLWRSLARGKLQGMRGHA